MLLTQILIAGPFASRPTASSLPNGTLYATTDTGVIYQVQSAAWATWYPAPSGTGTVTNVATGTGLTGGPITTTGTIALANTAVTPGTYGDATHVAQVTVDAQGRLTAASNVTISGGGGTGTLGGATVSRNATQSITNNSETALQFNTEEYDTDSYHDNSSNNTRLTVPATGLYLIVANVTWAADPGLGGLSLRRNGSDYLATSQFDAAASATRLHVSRIAQLTASDYVEATVYQNSGASVNISQAASYTPIFSIERLR